MYVTHKAAISNARTPVETIFFFSTRPQISQFLLAVSVAVNVISVYVSLRDSYLRWESIFEDTVAVGVQVVGGGEGGSGWICITWSESGPPWLSWPHRKTSLLKRLNVELIHVREDSAVLYTDCTQSIRM